jgi:hypothetical protein
LTTSSECGSDCHFVDLSGLDLTAVDGRGAGHGLFELFDHFASEFFVNGPGREAGGVAVTPATKMLGDARNIDPVFRTQADAIGCVRQFAEERDGFDVADGQRLVDDAVRIIFARTRILHRVLGHRDPGDSSCLVAL